MEHARRLAVSGKDMRMGTTPDPVPAEDELRPEYDLGKLRGGVRGKYHTRYRARLHLVRLAPDVATAFPTEEAVNRALRLLAELARQQVPQQPA